MHAIGKSKNSLSVNITAPTINPPRKSEPVSPISIFAGWKLNTRNASNAPRSEEIANESLKGYGKPH